MIGYTRELTDTLSHHWPNHAMQFDLLSGEDHATVVYPGLTRALRFIQQAAN